MSTRIFMCLSTKLASLHHVDESWFEFKAIVSNIDCRFGMNIGRSWSRELMKSLISHGFKTSVKLRLVWLSSDSKARTFLSLALVLLINASRSSMQFVIGHILVDILQGIFLVFTPSIRVKHLWVDIGGMVCFCAYPQYRGSAYVGGVYIILILRACQTSHTGQ